MGELPKKNSGEDESKKALGSLASEYSYLDYVIEAKFYKRFWGFITKLTWIIGVVFAVLAFFGFRTYIQLNSKLNQAKEANERIQEVYRGYLKEDSLKTIRSQNSKYYAYLLQNDERPVRESIQRKFQYYGFGFADASIEDQLSVYLYDHFFDNPATKWLEKTHEADSSIVAIGIVWRDLPDGMIARVDSIFRDVYPDSKVNFIRDIRLPKQGFLYVIR